MKQLATYTLWELKIDWQPFEVFVTNNLVMDEDSAVDCVSPARICWIVRVTAEA